MRTRNRKKKKGSIRKNDIRLLVCAAIFLVFSLLKCSNASVFSSIRDEFTTFFEEGNTVSTMAEDIGEKVKDSSSEFFSSDAVKAFAEKFFSSDSNPSTEGEDKDSEDELLSSSSFLTLNSELSLKTIVFQNSNDPSDVSREDFSIPFSYQKPVEGIISCGFGYRLHPIDKVIKFHYGIDIAAEEGTPIYSFANGTVKECGKNNIYGYYLCIKHKNNFYTFYGHCKKLYVKKGQTVQMGEQIASVGSTGKSTGNHLHFEIRKGDYKLNPTYYITYDSQA